MTKIENICNCPYKTLDLVTCPNCYCAEKWRGLPGRGQLPSHDMAVERLAIDVIDGWYGDGNLRKERLYDEVQSRVNRILSPRYRYI